MLPVLVVSVGRCRERCGSLRAADGPDVINRVAALCVAQTAFPASICGLAVNGKPQRAPPDGVLAVEIRKQYSQYR